MAFVKQGRVRECAPEKERESRVREIGRISDLSFPLLFRSSVLFREQQPFYGERQKKRAHSSPVYAYWWSVSLRRVEGNIR